MYILLNTVVILGVCLLLQTVLPWYILEYCWILLHTFGHLHIVAYSHILLDILAYCWILLHTVGYSCILLDTHPYIGNGALLLDNAYSPI